MRKISSKSAVEPTILFIEFIVTTGLDLYGFRTFHSYLKSLCGQMDTMVKEGIDENRRVMMDRPDEQLGSWKKVSLRVFQVRAKYAFIRVKRNYGVNINSNVPRGRE